MAFLTLNKEKRLWPSYLSIAMRYDLAFAITMISENLTTSSNDATDIGVLCFVFGQTLSSDLILNFKLEFFLQKLHQFGSVNVAAVVILVQFFLIGIQRAPEFHVQLISWNRAFGQHGEELMLLIMVQCMQEETIVGRDIVTVGGFAGLLHQGLDVFVTSDIAQAKLGRIVVVLALGFLLRVFVNGFFGDITCKNNKAMTGKVDGITAIATTKLHNGMVFVSFSCHQDTELTRSSNVKLPSIEIIPIADFLVDCLDAISSFFLGFSRILLKHQVSVDWV